jgi:hypothetical protein
MEFFLKQKILKHLCEMAEDNVSDIINSPTEASTQYNMYYY